MRKNTSRLLSFSFLLFSFQTSQAISFDEIMERARAISGKFQELERYHQVSIGVGALAVLGLTGAFIYSRFRSDEDKVEEKNLTETIRYANFLLGDGLLKKFKNKDRPEEILRRCKQLYLQEKPEEMEKGREMFKVLSKLLKGLDDSYYTRMKRKAELLVRYSKLSTENKKLVNEMFQVSNASGLSKILNEIAPVFVKFLPILDKVDEEKKGDVLLCVIDFCRLLSDKQLNRTTETAISYHTR